MQPQRHNIHRTSTQSDIDSDDDDSDDSVDNQRPSSICSPEGSSIGRGLPEIFKQQLYKDIEILGGIDCITIKRLAQYNCELYGKGCQTDRNKIKNIIYYWKKERAHKKGFTQSVSIGSPVRLIPPTGTNSIDLHTFSPLTSIPQDISTMSNYKTDVTLRSLIEANLTLGYLYEDVEQYNVKLSIDEGVIKLQRYSYGGIDVSLFGEKFEHLEKLYDGIEISALGDARDVPDKFFDAKLITRNAILIKTPATSRGFFEEYNQISKTFTKTHPSHEAVKLGHELQRADQSNDVNLRIRFALLKFPDFYQLGNEIFSKDACSNDGASSIVKYSFSAYSYTHDGNNLKSGNIRASWLFHKHTKNPPRKTIKPRQADQSLEEMNKMLRDNFLHATESTDDEMAAVCFNDNDSETNVNDMMVDNSIFFPNHAKRTNIVVSPVPSMFSFLTQTKKKPTLLPPPPSTPPPVLSSNFKTTGLDENDASDGTDVTL